MDKKNLVEKLIRNFQEKAEESRKLFESARQAAIDAPGAMQSKSDTTKFQMSQLAESSLAVYKQIQRCISTLKEIDLSRECKAIGIGAVVKVEEDQSESYYFILPINCGGQSIELEEQEVNAIAVKSPIAQALLNKKAGDIINIKVPASLRIFRIIEIE